MSDTDAEIQRLHMVVGVHLETAHTALNHVCESLAQLMTYHKGDVGEAYAKAHESRELIEELRETPE